MTATQVLYREHDVDGMAVGWLELSSHSGVNPLSSSTVRALRERFAQVGRAGAPRALVVGAGGRCYCAGADVKEFATFDTAAFRAYMTDILAMYVEMVEAAGPIVARVHADARGGGAALAFCADFVIAADDARFALPEAHRGLAGGGYLMPRLIGRQRAAEMVLLGRDFSAADMLRMGLVNEVCPADRLDERTGALLAELARIPPSAFVVGKRSLAAGLTMDLRSAMACHVDAQTEAFVAMRAARGAGGA